MNFLITDLILRDYRGCNGIPLFLKLLVFECLTWNVKILIIFGKFGFYTGLV